MLHLRRYWAIPESAETHPFERLGEPLGARRTLGEAVEPTHDAPAAEGDQRDALPLSGPPSHGVPCRNVEAHAPGPRAVEDEPAIDLEERVVRADEDGVIRGVLDVDGRGAATRIEHDRPICEQELTGLHREARLERRGGGVLRLGRP